MSNCDLHHPLPFPFIIFILCLVIPDILAEVVLSKECHEFCASRRPPGTTEKFKTFCGENNTGTVPLCPGACNGICPTALCSDGVNLQCPEAVYTPAPFTPTTPSPSPSASPHPHSIPSPPDSDSTTKGAPKNALLILFGILIALAVVIGIIVLCVYSTSKNRREHNVYPGQLPVLMGSNSMFSEDQSTGGYDPSPLYL